MERIKEIPISKYVTGSAPRIGTDKYRVNPCPQCGHDDCCTVYESTNSYTCFSCGSAGSVIDFYMASNGISDVSQAVQELAVDNGIQLKKNNSNNKNENKNREIFAEAAQYYHERALESKKAKEFFASRERSDEMVREQLYGFSDGHLGEYLLKKGYSKQELLDSGLVKEKNGKMYDFLGSDNIITPISYGNRVCDFHVRNLATDKNEKKRYQLPKDKKLGNILYYGQSDIGREKLILVEGQEDRNTLLETIDRKEYGVAATLGQVSDEQLQFLIDRCTEKSVLYLCFDADDGGKKYIDKIGNALFTKCLVMVITFEEEKDIDAYLRKVDKKYRSEELENLIVHAKDYLSYRINNTKINPELSPKMQEAIYMPILELIAKEKLVETRHQYVQLFNEHLNEDLPKEQKKSRAINYSHIVKSIIARNDDKEEWDDDDEEDDLLTVYQYKNRYFKRGENKKRCKLSEFIITIKRYVEQDDELYYEIVMTNFLGIVSKPVLLGKSERVNKKAFRETVANYGSFYYYGSDDDLSEIWQLEEKKANIESRTCYFSRYGYLKHHDVWLFENCAYKSGKLYLPEPNSDVIVIDGIGYRPKDVCVYGGDKPVVNTSKTPSIDYAKQIAKLNHKMWDDGNNSFRGFLLMGFLSSLVYLNEIVKAERLFPYILAFGPPGTGKSRAVQFIMNMIGFQNGGENWGESTPYGISQAIEQLSSLPFWIEEFSNSSLANPKQQGKVEILKNIYNRTSSGKGGINRKRMAMEVNAAILFTGQDRPENQALLSRCVVLRKEKPTPDNNVAFKKLKSENDEGNLSLVFRWLIETKSEIKTKQILENIQIYKNEMLKRGRDMNFEIDDRTVSNIAIFAACFSVYEIHEYDNEFVRWIAAEAVQDMKRKQSEDIVYRFFSDIEVMYDSIQRRNVMVRNGDTLFMRYNVVYSNWKQFQNSIRVNEIISEDGLKDYLRKAPEGYWIDSDEKARGNKRFYIDGLQVRGIFLSISKLPKHIKEVVLSWFEPENNFYDDFEANRGSDGSSSI